MIPEKPKNVTWTDEQWSAIYEDGKNIIVSAGAGSGKTAVLTERVIRKLKDGVHINQLLILTFTKAAASEMADRIRKKIKKIPELQEELNLLDSAYITTFDSFSLSVVRKYHYLINVSDKLDIIDANVMALKKKEFMEEVFLKLYQDRDSKFLKVIKNFCVKDDEEIKMSIIGMCDKLDLLSNKKEFLTAYLKKNYNIEKIDKDILKYTNLICSRLVSVREKVEDISFIDSDFASKLFDSLSYLLTAKDYDEIYERINVDLPRSPNGSDQRLKDLRKEIVDILSDIKKLMTYSGVDEIKDTVNMTRDTVEVIIKIIFEYWSLVEKYKNDNGCYEFSDIAIMAINILKNNDDVCLELLNSFNEIMIDEYQDTNDLQEEFISMISNHNVYMVGDIKQSIYRFRNANPYIFKEKYDNYSNSNLDKKIDLNKNFRSRMEVLDSINKIFNLIMGQNIGGADYINEHQMIFGNNSYLDEKLTHSNDLEIYSYDYDKGFGFTREEVEAFIVANDIVNKYVNKIKVFDKDTFRLRDIKYGDFSIIVDRSSSFDLYKKIFSYYGIPVTLLKDEKMNDDADINVIKNLIGFIILIKKREFSEEFKYLFISICRSFLFRFSDDEIFNYCYFNNYKDSELYKKCYKISKKIDSITILELLNIIEDYFSYFEKLVTIGNIENSIIKWDELKKLASNLENMGYDVEMFFNYLNDLFDNNLSVNYNVNDSNSNSVKIMTIHKSKGLEYPICYFSGLYKKFNISDLREKFIYDKKVGMVVPYFKDGIGETIYKELLREDYIREEISEKIRLFYVALTRAREKIIIINPIDDKHSDFLKNVNVMPSKIKLLYRSFADIINSIGYQLKDYNKVIDIENLGLTHDYNAIRSNNYEKSIVVSNDIIEVEELELKEDIISKNHFSKKVNDILTKEDYKNMQLGTKFHEMLELIDFKNPNWEMIGNDFYMEVIEKFLNSEELKDIDKARIYKEFDFIYQDNGVQYHGIIDLMLDFDDHLDIVDYKLKYVQDDAYKKQLMGYKNYMGTKVNKRINLYLYSILDNKFYLVD